MGRIAPVIACIAIVTAACVVAGDDKKPGQVPPAFVGSVDFARDIEPIFKQHCLKCHNGEKERGGLRLDDKKTALEGGNSGVVIIPGKKAAESKLLHLVAGIEPDLKMPPAGPALTADQIGKLRAWIEQGAKWEDRREKTENRGQKPGDKGQRTENRGQKTKHWAFQPVSRPTTPNVKNAAWVRNPIDAFVLARLEKEGVAPSPEADRPTLLRRLCLDVLGLPPTLEQYEEFINDTSPAAYERLVDRLLTSPHYGERWGRHWLDAARYADSDGFEKDSGRPWAWRWRDWVIHAFNADMPFDQFAIEQLAGDLLPNATLEQKTATGFHRNTLTNIEGGVDQEQFRVEQVIDRVNTTATVFLGVTLGCAQCHDHKFDPFSQREYYQFFAFFNSDRETDLDAPLPGEMEKFQKAKAAFELKRAELQKALSEYKNSLPGLQVKWETELQLPALRALPKNVQEALLVDPKDRADAQKKVVAEHFAKSDKKHMALTKALSDHDKKAPKLSQAPTMARGPDRKSHVLIRGDFLRPGAEVRADVPAVIPVSAKTKAMDGTPAANRLDLAHWIVEPANPLTRRVLANWLWQHHFGRALVITPNDLGIQGEKPSHPELLDWLASEVLRRKWSLKAMHRLIVTSATYRQSSHYRPELRDRDANNVWLARQNRLRLEAEIVRDASLAASGLLTRTIGGPSVRPPQPPGISDLTYAGSARWVESTGPDRYRRGMYVWFQRTSPYPMLMTFDAPDSNVCCVRRERSNTPLQALTLLNDTVFVECAQNLARRVISMPTKSDALKERIANAVRICLGREPTTAEIDRLAKLYQSFIDEARQQSDDAIKLAGKEVPRGIETAEAAAWTALARVLLNLDEFVTRE